MTFAHDSRAPAPLARCPTPVSRRTVFKRAASAFVVAAVPTLVVAGPAWAAEGSDIQPGDTVEIVDGPLNLRDGPGLDYAVIISFPEGTRFLVGDGPVAADGYSWIEIVPGGDAPRGWLAAEFLRTVDDLQEGPRFEVSDGPVNIRAQAGLGSAIIGSAPTGAQGHATAPDSVPMDGYTWALVVFDDGREGWIATDFVRWLSPSEESRFEVRDGPLNIRAQAGLDAEIVGSAPTGAQGSATAPESVPMDGFLWALVRFDDGQSGWIAIDFVDWLS